MGYPSFESVHDLDGRTLRQLLAVGDPVERVWAAWSLALELGRDVVPLLLSSLASARPATRRCFVIILAGLGERETLQRLTAEEPDDRVRATAS